MKKIKNLYMTDCNGVNHIVVETEDGTLYKQEDIPTGNCWMLYWVQPEAKKVEELAKLILKVNKAQHEKS